MVGDLQSAEERNLLRFFLRRLGNRADAADATQETFLRLLSAPSSTKIENPRAYLFQIAKNISFTILVRRRVAQAMFGQEQEGYEVADDCAGPEQTVDVRQRLSSAIAELPPRCQEVFYLSRISGHSNREISQKLDISVNMVEKHIIKALMHCRRRRAELF